MSGTSKTVSSTKSADVSKYHISVVVTVYNKKTYINKCISSLMEQTDGRFKAVIIDDSSDDGSFETVKDMIEGDARFRLIKQEHGGVASAKNNGVAYVDTPYMILLDGDDFLGTDAISVLNEIVAASPPDLLVYGFSHIMSNGVTYDHISKVRTYESRSEIVSNFSNIWNTGLMYSACNKLFCMDIIKENNIKFDEIDFGEDFAFCRAYLKCCHSLSFLDKSLYYYTFHNDASLSTIYREDLFEIRLSEHKIMCEYFAEIGADGEKAEEFLARRHAERVIGCIENEHSPHNPSGISEKYRRIKEMVDNELTKECILKAAHSGWKMKILFIPVKFKLYFLVFILGKVMSVCRNNFPKIFAKLKMT